MQQYGLVGYPIGHSFSGEYFSAKFLTEKIEAVYHNFPMQDVADIVPILEKNSEIEGFNITIPHKTNILPYLDSMDEGAQKVGAVNVVKVTRSQGRYILKGFNTDVIGFENSLKPHLRSCHKKALVFGTGGASKAVVYVLHTLGIEYAYVSRNVKQGQLTYSDLTPEIIAEHKLLVNCTPLGMSPNIGKCPDIPYQAINSDHYLFDLIYNPEISEFLNRGKTKGATIKNGLEMLYLQADAAWEIWNNPLV